MRFLLAAVLAGLVLAYRSLGSAVLDGSAWTVRLRGKFLLALPRKDTLVFERGRFLSSRYLSSGYLPGGYSAEGTGSSASRFSAAQVREDGSFVEWAGEVRGDRMKGTVVLTEKDGRRKSYTFRGSRRPGAPRARPFVSGIGKKAAAWLRRMG